MVIGQANCRLRLLLAWFILTSLVLSGTAAAATNLGSTPESTKNIWQRSFSSWAWGVVVPDGASLQGGGSVTWKSATNLTAVARLPNITEPDGATYVVLSAMGENRDVFQVAAGISLKGGQWTAYSWSVSNLDSTSPDYLWVLNSSAPEMSPNDVVAISIAVAGPHVWEFSIEDENSSHSVAGTFPSKTAASFAAGDQEVFALESYTRSESTFRQMGNMTLEALTIDNRTVVGGWYIYSGWDAVHNPLFVLGNSAPPSFISLAILGEGRMVWNYAPPWSGAGWSLSPSSISLGLLALAGLILLAVLTGAWLLDETSAAGRRALSTSGSLCSGGSISLRP